MTRRVDFIIKDTQGKFATGIRVYIDHKQVKGLKRLDVAEGYEITYRNGSFYWMFTLFADERDIEIKDSTLKISQGLRNYNDSETQ